MFVISASIDTKNFTEKFDVMLKTKFMYSFRSTYKYKRKWEKIIMYRMRAQHSIYYLDLVDTEGGRKAAWSKRNESRFCND